MKDEEMAEEYATRECCTTCKNINHFCKEKCECWTFAKNGLLAGLKAGRPKWHKVADGDLPKEKGNYLVAWERTHHVEEFGKWGFDVDLFNADEGYFEGVGDYVIAWKEIVLPKEDE